MKQNKNFNKTINNKKESIWASIILGGMFLGSFGSLMYIFHEEKTLHSGTVVEKIETNKGVKYLIDTDENKDTIEKVIELKNNNMNFLYIENIKEGSKIQFKTFKGLNDANIYQIDDFITKRR